LRYRGHSITHRSACALPLTLIQRHSALCRRGQDLSLQRPCCGSVFFFRRKAAEEKKGLGRIARMAPMTERWQVNFPSGSGRSTASVHRIVTCRVRPHQGLGRILHEALPNFDQLQVARRRSIAMHSKRQLGCESSTESQANCNLSRQDL